MRGIAGLIQFNAKAVAAGQVGRMLDRLAVRPADHVGHGVEGVASLGHVLTNTTVEDRLEAQPVRSVQGHDMLVTDILLENREELAAELGWSSDELALQPDSALVMAAWERWGEACPLHLEAGTSATAVWHPESRELFCFVGHLSGTFYYWYRDGVFAFATTLRGLFALPEVSREIDEQALAEHLVRVPHDPGRTLYRDVWHLEPGTSLRVSSDGLEVTRYWRMPEPIELRLGSDAEYVDAYRSELTAAVRRKLRSARGVGCLVSGGLDSVSIAVIAGRLLAEEGKRLQVLHTLPLGESRYHWELRELDESRYVRMLEAHAPYMDFHYEKADPEPLPLAEWDDYFSIHCIPSPSIPIRGNSHFGPIIEGQGIDRLLTGLGGNLVVSMESRPWNYLRHLASDRRGIQFIRELWGEHRVYGTPWRRLFKQALSPESRVVQAQGSAARARILAPEFRRRVGIEDKLRALDANAHPEGRLRQRMYRHFNGPMREGRGTPGAAIDRNAGALRSSPMGDRRLNEFCLSLPFAQQIRDGWDRRLLRVAMEGWLPDALRWRVTRGLPQPAFQFKYTSLMQRLGGAGACLDSLHRAPEYLDLNHIRAVAGKKNADQKWSADLAVLQALILERYLSRTETR